MPTVKQGPNREWYIVRGGKEFGPIGSEVLSRGFDTGTIVASDLVWTAGLSEWIPITDVVSSTPAGAKSSGVSNADGIRKRRATTNRRPTLLKAVLNHTWKAVRVASDDAWRRIMPFKVVKTACIRCLSEARRALAFLQSRVGGEVLRNEDRWAAFRRIETEQDPRRAIRQLNLMGFALTALLICGVGGWAATSQLAGAVIAAGTIVVEFEHQEGAASHRRGGGRDLRKGRRSSRRRPGCAAPRRYSDTVHPWRGAVPARRADGEGGSPARRTRRGRAHRIPDAVGEPPR